MDLVPAISLRENERGAQIGAGWDPNWHQPTDVFATYSDKDFRLGLNAAQTTLAAVAELTGAHCEVAVSARSRVRDWSAGLRGLPVRGSGVRVRG